MEEGQIAFRQFLIEFDTKYNSCHSESTGQFCSSTGSGTFVEGDPQELNNYYDLKSKCGKEIDCEAIHGYTGSGYKPLNTMLRTGKYKTDFEWRENEVRALQTGLDKSFENAPTVPKDIKVYRGMGPEVVKGLQPGDTFIDKGFISTSISSTETQSGIQFEVRVPKGTKGIYVEKVSNVASEMEMLLNRGTKFRVIETNITTNKFGNPVGSGILEVVL